MHGASNYRKRKGKGRWEHGNTMAGAGQTSGDDSIEDVDTLTDKLFANFYPATLSRCRVVAEYLSKWLKEG